MTAETDYRAVKAINISSLKYMRHSPSMYQYRLQHAQESDSMAFGTLAHLLTLEPHRFERDVAVWTSRTEAGAMSPRRGKAWDAFVAEHAGKTLVTENEYLDASALAAAVRANPAAMRYLVDGAAEVPLYWEWPVGPCKGRLDFVTRVDGKTVVVGLKTSRDCRPIPFGSQAFKLGYHLQWAWYHDGYETAHGEFPRMVEIVVDSSEPHHVVVYDIPDEVLEYGRQEYQALLETLGHCRETGDWPGPARGEVTFTLPTWVWRQDENDITSLGLEEGDDE